LRFELFVVLYGSERSRQTVPDSWASDGVILLAWPIFHN